MGAIVTGHWEGAATDTFAVTTDINGLATDYSNSVTSTTGLIFRCVVDSVSDLGWVYDSAANKQTSGSATVP